jgi:hypothetical protein
MSETKPLDADAEWQLCLSIAGKLMPPLTWPVDDFHVLRVEREAEDVRVLREIMRGRWDR